MPTTHEPIKEETTKKTRILIVGASAAGASAAARARRLCGTADITLVERGADISYAACGLPYHIGEEIAERGRLIQHTPASLATLLGVTVRTSTEAVAIDRARKILLIKNATGATGELAYDKLILAPGAAPLRPALPGIDNPRILTLRTLQDMDRIKKAAMGSASSVLIAGAGFIGLEMAEQLSQAGLATTIVEMAPQVLPQLDPEMTRDIERELRAHDITLVLGDGVEAFSANQNCTARLRSGRELAADLVILSIGVKPESALAAAAGLALGERGAIKVNEWLQTSDPDIYAAGDAVENRDRVFERPMNLALGGPANRQGRIIADHIFQKTPAAPGLAALPYPGHLGTAIVRVFGAAAGVTGWTEKRLRAAGIAHNATIVTDYHHASFFPDAKPLTLKILWSPGDGRLLGAQASGAEGVDKRVDVLATALAARMTIDDLAQLELAYAPPYGSARDVVNTAGFVAQNQRAALVPLARELPGPGGRRLLDVRPRKMVEEAPIPGALNIPLMELRARLGELDKTARWAVVCLYGKTSYFAARTLAQNGFDVVSICGGLKVAGRNKPGE